MKWLRVLDPRRLARAISAIREVHNGGGPAKLRLVKVAQPEGWFLPGSEVVLEVVARDGSKTEFRPVMPVPFPYAWAYRLAVALGVPLIADLDPERLHFEVGVPRLSD